MASKYRVYRPDSASASIAQEIEAACKRDAAIEHVEKTWDVDDGEAVEVVVIDEAGKEWTVWVDVDFEPSFYVTDVSPRTAEPTETP